eukprot:TRINITY_DN3383_c0_g1_i1.p1 TRINITY_DN3383_c0_g1~~TRINITY_DN3383_c0_g1_i1.p1  ORF type:complete len:433 (-),score=73.28 TRINITY_DN3383_c0_g1_i1:32-1330(-)
MSTPRRVFLLGGAITPFLGKGHPDFVAPGHPLHGKQGNPTLEDCITNAVLQALESTGTPPSVVQRAYIGNFTGELFNSQGHLGAAVAGAHPDLQYVPCMRLEGACASGGLATAAAVDAIRAGADVVLVVGAEVQTTVSAREGADYLARASHYRRQALKGDFTFPAMFARRIKAYTAKYPDVTERDIARVAVKAFSNANKNPLAHMHTASLDLETAASSGGKNPHFLKHPELKSFLKISDCSQVSDGGAAMVLVSEDGLKKLGKKLSETVEILSLQYAADSLYLDTDPTQLLTMAVAAKRAYAEAKVSPNEISVAEVHDCFTIAEILMYEAMGWAAPGKGADLLRNGTTELTGRLPVNTGGGLIGFGHPVGATGIKQLLEVFRQMKGKCGAYQVPNSSNLRYGLCANMGGDDKTAVVTILGQPVEARTAKPRL